MSPGLQVLVVAAKIVFVLGFVLGLLPVVIWMERKGAAFLQDRPGPNRAGVLGIRASGALHAVADVIKLVFKEDVVPSGVERGWWALAPLVGLTTALVTFGFVPFGDEIRIAGQSVRLQVVDAEGGALFVLAFTSLSVYGTMLAGWASNNKFSLLGGLRASAQTVSYELAMGLTFVSVLLVYGTLALDRIVEAQAGAPWHWGVAQGFGIVGVPAFVLFFVAVFAETNRVPFDLPEGEAELVGGFHTEYSSLRFALFFMGEYAALVVSSAVVTTFFFGGWQVPFLDGTALRLHAGAVLAAVGIAVGIGASGGAVLALRARRRRFYRALLPADPRRREPLFWAVVWTVAALGGLGLAVAGLVDLPARVPWGPGAVAIMAQFGAFTVKTLFGCWCFVWVRWTLPRFRYDQIMDLGWRRLVPLALALVGLTAVWVVARETWGGG
ncbi:MAG: NADH-quinone oxidoreductase subunit H [Deltaproteobacteria bacterium]|nr:NADH-quinone oxidoreductase subunit H [Deltaproteobacteria bacterium]